MLWAIRLQSRAVAKTTAAHCANKGMCPEETQLQRQSLPVRHLSRTTPTEMCVTMYIDTTATNLSLELLSLQEYFLNRLIRYDGM